MKLKVKDIKIATGTALIALINKQDAVEHDFYYADRVKITKAKKSIVATLDITASDKLVPPGKIGLFEDLYKGLGVRTGQEVSISIIKKPKSVEYIKMKLKGKRLNEQQYHEITNDIANGVLTNIETTYFVSACYIHELDMNEAVALTKAMYKTGDILKLPYKIIADKHCIGGVAANRTTIIVVPILAAAGLIVPKTSSRAITSAAGTADTMSVFCNVSMSLDKMKKIIKKTNAYMAWGGGVNLAPADDEIIRVEYPLSLDPTGQLLASILSKKKSVSTTHLLVDIPLGKGAKIESKTKALLLKRKFEKISKRIGMKIKVVITDGRAPIGNGIGPALEARDALWTLLNSKHGSQMLKQKSLFLAGQILEMTGKAKKTQGIHMAREILESGKAYKKFLQIIKAQNGKEKKPGQIRLGKLTAEIKAKKSGKVMHMSNSYCNKIARIAGAPQNPRAGVYMRIDINEKIKKGQTMFTIYSDNKERLKEAVEFAKKEKGIRII